MIPAPPTFLKDGSFLLAQRTQRLEAPVPFRPGRQAERSGDERRMGGDQRPLHQRSGRRVDETNGWVYFTAAKDSPIAANLYRVKLDGSSLERLTTAPGDHRVAVSPKGNLFVDTWSSHAQAGQGAPLPGRRHAGPHAGHQSGLRPRGVSDRHVRAGADQDAGRLRSGRQPTEAAELRPETTLSGVADDLRRPALPTIRDRWHGGRLNDEMLAHMGFVVCHVDPRSASGRGHRATWTAYRQLGVQELKDIETAMNGCRGTRGWTPRASA